MPSGWTVEQIAQLQGCRELEITTIRGDGTVRPWVPIWVVCVGADAYVRTWYRRETGWFGHAVRSSRARIRVFGVETDVSVDDVGLGPSAVRPDVDAAYVAKYGTGGGMIADAAAETTLRLIPAAAHAGGRSEAERRGQ